MSDERDSLRAKLAAAERESDRKGLQIQVERNKWHDAIIRAETAERENERLTSELVAALEAAAPNERALAAMTAQRDAMREWIHTHSGDTCYYNILREVCVGCGCIRATIASGAGSGE